MLNILLFLTENLSYYTTSRSLSTRKRQDDRIIEHLRLLSTYYTTLDSKFSPLISNVDKDDKDNKDIYSNIKGHLTDSF